MGRRSDHTPDQLKELFLDAARQQVATSGAEGLTARAIAGRAGYSAGTLYNLFENIDELVLHLNAETLDQLADALGEALRDEEDAFGFFERLSGAYFAFVRGYRPFWDLLMQVEHHPPGKAIPSWYQERVDRLFQTVEVALEPHLTGESPARASRVLWAGLHGISMLSLAGKLASTGSESPEVLCRSLFENYLRGQQLSYAASESPLSSLATSDRKVRT